MNERFKNRSEAGQLLAKKLRAYSFNSKVLVLALPRGGVPVGYEVAKELEVPLEIFLVRKLGVPGHEEFAMGAVAPGGIWFVNDQVVARLGISRQEIQRVVTREEKELERRLRAYGAEYSTIPARNHVVILVDDGLATGSTMRVAVSALKRQRPERIIIAVPVAAAATCQEFQEQVDEIICLQTPKDFYAVGQWYEDFSQISDDEVRQLLAQARKQMEPMPANSWPAF